MSYPFNGPNEAQDLDNDGNTTTTSGITGRWDTVSEIVSPHNLHPTPILSVKTVSTIASARVIKIIKAPDTRDTTLAVQPDEFQLVVEFTDGKPTPTAVIVVNDSNTTGPVTNATAVPLDFGEFTIEARKTSDGSIIDDPVVTSGNAFVVARIDGTANTNLHKYLITIRLAAAVVTAIAGDSTADPVVPADPVTFKIRLNGRSAYTLKTTDAFGVDRDGGASRPSNVLEVTLQSGAPDQTGPVLTISHDPDDAPAAGSNVDKATFTFSFNEALGTRPGDGLDADEITVDNGTAGTLSEAVYTEADDTATPAVLESTVYTLEVTLTDKTKPVTVTVAKESVKDTAGNASPATDMSEKFTPDNMAPVLTITSAAHATDTEKAVYTFSFKEPILSTSFTKEDLTITNGEAKDDPVATSEKVYTATIDVTDVYTPTTVTVTGEVTDKAGNAFTLATEGQKPTITLKELGPGVVLVKASAYTIVVRDKDAIGNEGLRFPSGTNVVEWSGMPDLQWHFDRKAIGGGGAITLEKVAGQTAPDGSVGIGEIMWGIDNAYLGQARAKNSQWIELHNLNSMDVEVQLVAMTAAQAKNDGDIKVAGAGKVTGVLDVVTNAFNHDGPTKPGWDLPGQSGDSSTGGVNFVSMRRKETYKLNLTKDTTGYKEKGYLDGALDGRNSGNWAASTAMYLQLRNVTGKTFQYYKFIGTPGVSNYVKPGVVAATKLPNPTVIFNEVANRDAANKAYEWI